MVLLSRPLIVKRKIIEQLQEGNGTVRILCFGGVMNSEHKRFLNTNTTATLSQITSIYASVGPDNEIRLALSDYYVEFETNWDPSSFRVFAKRRVGLCGTTWVGLIKIRSIPDEVPIHRRTVIGYAKVISDDVNGGTSIGIR